jgi:tetratricopeptide (TPR) repeat protein
MNEADVKKLNAEILRASKLLKQGQRSEALIIYGDVTERAGLHASLNFELGQLCQQIGDIDQAVMHFRVAADVAPGNSQYAAMLGIAYLNAEEFENARESLEQALESNPDVSEVQHGLGVYYMKRADYESAIDYLERACQLRPRDANIRTNLTTTLIQLNRHDEALAHAQKAVKLDDSHPMAQLALSKTLAEVGDVPAAVKQLELAVRKNPTYGGTYDLLARMKKFSAEDASFMGKTEKLLDRGMPPRERCAIHYALGKMHDDCADYDKAFAHFDQANLLQKKPYDIDRDKRLLKGMLKVFTSSALNRGAPIGDPTSVPVFVVGMPRSGTTLMERIIASHSQGAGAGELPAIPYTASVIFGDYLSGKSISTVKQQMDPEKLREYADRYLEILRQGRIGADRIVDKMPGNFLFVGLIKTVFPNATIINAVRHPLDVALSCYFQNFSDLRWANDFKLIAQIYAIYRRAMDYWASVLPEGSILDVQYEQLVEDPEHHARRMIEACGLDWEPSVLEFFRKKGVVRTASIAQSRNPIYTTSKMRWMNYAKHLGPVAADLAPYLESSRDMLLKEGIELPSSGWLKRMLR